MLICAVMGFVVSVFLSQPTNKKTRKEIESNKNNNNLSREGVKEERRNWIINQTINNLNKVLLFVSVSKNIILL